MGDPCLNGGNCTDAGSYDKYTCACPEEFTGEQCQGNFENSVYSFGFRFLNFSPDADIKFQLTSQLSVNSPKMSPGLKSRHELDEDE